MTKHHWVLRRAAKAGTATKTKPGYIGFRVTLNRKSCTMPVTGVNKAPYPASASLLSNRRTRWTAKANTAAMNAPLERL